MRGERELKKGSTPVLILAVLGEGPRHGYGIAKEIQRFSADALKMGEGTLYPALRKLEQDLFIISEWQVQPSGPARKVYQLTEKGHGELTRHKSAWRHFSEAVDLVLEGRPMSNPPEKDAIEQYLDEVYSHFSMMPVEEADQNRLELSQHIHASVDDRVDAGALRDEAIEAALKKFGPAKKVGLTIAMTSHKAWMRELEDQFKVSLPRWVNRLDAAACVALGVAGSMWGWLRIWPSLFPELLTIVACLGLFFGIAFAFTSDARERYGPDYGALIDELLRKYSVPRRSWFSVFIRFTLILQKEPMKALSWRWWLGVVIWMAILLFAPVGVIWKHIVAVYTLPWVLQHIAGCVTRAMLIKRYPNRVA